MTTIDRQQAAIDAAAEAWWRLLSLTRSTTSLEDKKGDNQ